MAKKSGFDMKAIKNKTIEYLKELEQIELKRSKRYKHWEEKYKEHLIKAGEISGLIKIYEEFNL